MFKADFCPDSVSGLCCAKITTQPQQIIIQGTIHFNNLAEKSQNHKEQLSCRTELQKCAQMRTKDTWQEQKIAQKYRVKMRGKFEKVVGDYEWGW